MVKVFKCWNLESSLDAEMFDKDIPDELVINELLNKGNGAVSE